MSAEMTVEFVNLRQAGLSQAQAVLRLTRRHLEQGERLLILAADQLQAEEVDRMLWVADPASFLPHALAGGPDQEREPALIATSPENLNQARALMALTPLEPEQALALGYEHLIDFVPVEEGPHLAAARERYRRFSQLPGVRMLHTTSLPGRG